MFFGRHVTEHRAAVPTDHRGADPRCEVVVTGRDICRQWPQRVKRRFVAMLELQVHVLFDQVHRYVARPFDHRLHVVLPGHFRQLTERS